MNRQIGEYIIIQNNIAKGAFATIHKGKHIYTDTLVAIKELKVSNINNLKRHVNRELEIHKKLDHPNIVKLYDIIFETNENIIYMILEYCEYGDLQKYQNKKPLSEKIIQEYMIQLRNALKYLHDCNIVHRDLKPANILLKDPLTIKITDFGLARNNISTHTHNLTHNLAHNLDEYNDSNEDLFSTYCGSPIYMSPELLNRQNYNSKSDLWSIGIILYELITGHPPYIASNIKQLINKVNTQNINLTDIKNKYYISSQCFDLLQKLLTNNKNNRVDWNYYFNHPWFNYSIILEYENKLIEEPLNYDNILNKQHQEHQQHQQEHDKYNNKIIQNHSHNHSITNSNTSDDLNSRDNSRDNIKLNDKLQIKNYNSRNHNISSTSSKSSKSNIQKHFTYSLKSSNLNISLNSSNSPNSPINSSINFNININKDPISENKDINLSDLEQDDIIDNTSRNKSSQNNITQNNKSQYTGTQPIPINNKNQNRNYFINNDISSSSSSNLSNTPKSFHNTLTRINSQYKIPESPSRIYNAIKFIKETYDYINSDTKSL